MIVDQAVAVAKTVNSYNRFRGYELKPFVDGRESINKFRLDQSNDGC